MIQSKRRMLVARRRIKKGIDVLQRQTKKRRWTYFQFFRHVEQNHQWALPCSKVCFRNHERMIRELQEPNHWSIYRK